MKHARTRWLMAALLVLLPGLPASAQTSITEFLPEIDAYVRLSSNVRFAFQAKANIQEGDLARSEIGPSIEAYLKPLEALKHVTIFDLDEMKSTPVLFSIGYRYLPSPNRPTVNRVEHLRHVSFSSEGSTDHR